MTFNSLSKVLAAMLLAVGASAQTQISQITNEWPDTRYTDHGDGTVSDIATGLMWAKCSVGQSETDCVGDAATLNWQGALEAASSSTLAGHSDWRLPNIKELASLAALDRYGTAINTTAFPNTPSEYFWSSSPSTNDSGDAWGVNFSIGGDYLYNRADYYRVRLVRSSQ